MKSNNALRMMLSSLVNQPDGVPPGFKTVDEHAKDFQLGRRQAQYLIGAGVKAGVMEKKTFRIKSDCDGRVIPVPHYQIGRAHV